MHEFPYKHIFNNAKVLLQIDADGDFVCVDCQFAQDVKVVIDFLNTGCDFVCLGCEKMYRVSRKKKEWVELETKAKFYIWDGRKALFTINKEDSLCSPSKAQGGNS